MFILHLNYTITSAVAQLWISVVEISPKTLCNRNIQDLRVCLEFWISTVCH